MKKKLLILLVVAAMIMTTLAFAACLPSNGDSSNNPPTDNDTPGGSIDSGDEEVQPEPEYVFYTDGQGTITSLTEVGKNLKSITVPEKIGNETIIGIGEQAFYNQDKMKSVNLPSGLTSIGYRAFQRCKELVEIVIPDTVTEIGDETFEECASLTSVTLSKSLKSVPELAFSGCESLKSIEIPEGIETIEEFAFESCEALESVTLPQSLKQLSRCVFQFAGLKSIELPDSVTYMGEQVFGSCKNLETVKLSQNISVIADYTFMGCSALKNVVIPSVYTIGRSAFSSCKSLTEITIPATVSSIKSSAFNNCVNLKQVTIEDQSALFAIESWAFASCESLQEIEIPKGVLTIGYSTFGDCKYLAIYAEREKTATGWDKLWSGDCPFVLGAVSHGITDDGVKWGVTKNGIIVITGSADDVEVVELPDTIDGKSVQEISKSAFYNMENISDLIVPDSITAVGQYIAKSANHLVIYSKAEEEQEWASEYNNPILWNYKSRGVDANGIRWGLTQDDIMTIVGCKNSGAELDIPSVINGVAVKSICNNAFANNGDLTKVTLPSGLVCIANGVFKHCGNLEEVGLPESLQSVGADAFSYCSGLISIEFGGSLTSIGQNAFSYCTKLKNITIPDNVSVIGAYAFADCDKIVLYCEAESAPSGWEDNWNRSNRPVIWDCKNNDSVSSGEIYYTSNDGVRYILNDGKATVNALTKKTGETLTIPDCVTYKDVAYQVTSISNQAFAYGEFKSISLPASIVSVGKKIFVGCSDSIYNEYDNALYVGNSANPYMILVKNKKSDITSCTINADAKIIAPEAFEYCRSLGSIEISSGVKVISDGAFRECSAMTSITLTNGLARIEQYAFTDCTNLTSIVIPISVNYIGYYAFTRCNNLSIYCEAAAEPGAWGYNWNPSGATVTWGYNNITTDENFDYVIHDGKAYLTKFKGESTQVAVPETIDGKQVVSIGMIFYHNDNIRSVQLPSGVTAIDSYAFYMCSRLNSIELPANLKSIGTMAFFSCDLLHNIYIPESVTTIEEKAFYSCRNLTINCRVASKPSGWNSAWNLKGLSDEFCTVVWNYVAE